MSFLNDLIDKKNRLRPVETKLTTLGFVVDTAPDDVPAKITETLYLGSQDCAEPLILTRYGIKKVLSVGIGIEVEGRCPEVAYRFVPCLDLPETDIVGTINECYDFLKEAEEEKEAVLVHCNAGVSRSSSVVIGYLMSREGLDFDAALDRVKRARGCVRPNAGFEAQLRKMGSLKSRF